MTWLADAANHAGSQAAAGCNDDLHRTLTNVCMYGLTRRSTDVTQEPILESAQEIPRQ